MELDITIDPWKKLVIHEVVEYRFEDFLKQVASQSRAMAGGIMTINWANGIVFHYAPFPDAELVVEEKLKGVLHWTAVVFAVKEKFEKQVVKDYGTVNFIDASASEIFNQLGEMLRKQSKYVS